MFFSKKLIRTEMINVENNFVKCLVFKGFNFDSAEIEDTIYSNSLDIDTKKQINKNFQKTKKSYPKIFNGNLTFLRVSNDNPSKLFFLKGKYADYLSMESSMIDFNSPCGIDILMITKDNYLVIGSRDNEKENQDEFGNYIQSYKLQIPSGFVDFKKKSIDKIKNFKQAEHFFVNEAIREINEEILMFDKTDFISSGIIGHTIQETESEYNYIRSVFVLLHVNKTLQEIKQERLLQPPKDLGEIKKIHGIDINDLQSIVSNKDDIQIYFDGQERSFVENSRFGIILLSEII